jgi:MoaA/NifB/PqqE/SkfB family radical SAM enzyme
VGQAHAGGHAAQFPAVGRHSGAVEQVGDGPAGVYGATEESFDGLTQRRGSWKAFRRGVDAAREAGLPLRLNIVVTEDSAHEVDAMVGMAENWGLRHHVYTNMTPTIYGGPESLLAQSSKHLRERTP